MNQTSIFGFEEDTYVDMLPLYMKTPLMVKYLRSWGTIMVDTVKAISSFWNDLNIDRIDAGIDADRDVVTKLGLAFGFPREFGFTHYDLEAHEWVENTVWLKDHHLIRLVRTKVWGVGFDGTRESLIRNISTTLGSSSGESTGLKIIIANHPEYEASVRAQIIYDDRASWDDVDTLLWNSGLYLNPTLGIEYSLEALHSRALIYDSGSGKYDDEKVYDGGRGTATSEEE